MIWVLLVVMQFKHFIADYILQGSYMLGKFKSKGWVLPLAAHCSVHFWFTFVIGAVVFMCTANPHINLLYTLVGIASLDFVVHFIMDRVKADPNLLGRFTALSKNEMVDIKMYSALGRSFKKELDSNKYFWWSLGLDQMVHHLTDIVIIYLIMGAI